MRNNRSNLIKRNPTHHLFSTANSASQSRLKKRKHSRKGVSMPSQHQSKSHVDHTNSSFLSHVCCFFPGLSYLWQKPLPWQTGFIYFFLRASISIKPNG